MTFPTGVKLGPEAAVAAEFLMCGGTYEDELEDDVMGFDDEEVG